MGAGYNPDLTMLPSMVPGRVIERDLHSKLLH